MPLDLDDGYTLEFATSASVQDGGVLLYSALPVVSGRYRPATWEELQTFRWKYNRAQSGAEEVGLVAGMIAAHVVAWDVRQGEEPLKITPENARRLPEPIANQLIAVITKWAPRQAGDEKNSDGGSASGSPNPANG